MDKDDDDDKRLESKSSSEFTLTFNQAPRFNMADTQGTQATAGTKDAPESYFSSSSSNGDDMKMTVLLLLIKWWETSEIVTAQEIIWHTRGTIQLWIRHTRRSKQV
jgi:hypothetical protein